MPTHDFNRETSYTREGLSYGTVVVDQFLPSRPLGEYDLYDDRDGRICSILSEYCEGRYGHWMDARRFAEMLTYRSKEEGYHGHLSRSAAWVQRWVYWSKTSKGMNLDGPCDFPWTRAKVEVQYVTDTRAAANLIDRVNKRTLNEEF